MELWMTDAEGRRYELIIESNPDPYHSLLDSKNRTEHHVEIRAGIKPLSITTDNESDPTEVMNMIFNAAGRRIKNWLEGK